MLRGRLHLMRMEQEGLETIRIMRVLIFTIRQILLDTEIKGNEKGETCGMHCIEVK
jgi:hypothetical protein